MAVAVSLAKVIETFEFATDDNSSYVNIKTGEVRMVMHDVMRLAEEDADDKRPEWQREAIVEAREVLDSEDWTKLPTKFDINEWSIMDRFAFDAAADIRAELRDSLRGAGAFRRFKDAVFRLNLQNSWFEYRTRSLEEFARRWLADHGLVVCA